ncbi:PadR family transcriptional regulator, partial [Limosilactobacillus mucosae]|nr:PadR family transcriptional regulator [Limosilactobacillus mucosae]
RYYRITSAGESHLARVKQVWTDYKESLDSIFEASNYPLKEDQTHDF